MSSLLLEKNKFMSQFYKLSIKDIHRETDKCVTISFNVPTEFQEEFKFKAGQYLTLKAIINGEEVRRDYSICSAPKSGELTVAVKEVENGTFSKFANRILKPNDVLDVASPNGRFIFEPDANKQRTIVAFAAGSGITPIMSIAKTILEHEPKSNFMLIYGNKTPKDTIFFNEILELHHNYLDRFNLQLVFSQSDEENALFGRIEKSTVNFIVKNKYKHVDVDDFYICGPEQMIDTVKDVLKENEVNENSIHFELFTTSKDKSDSSNLTSDGNTEITVLVDDEETTFSMSQKKSILEAALAENIDAPYSCQGGICSSCIARIKEGKATMRQNNILTDNEVEEGLVLTCQAHPTTSSIIVDYDDV